MKIRSSISTLKNDIIEISLDSIHDNFITVPTDKANDKIAKTFKFFYKQVLRKEFGIDNKLKKNSTYEYLPNTDIKVFILSQSNFILRTFQQKVNKKNQFLASVYWMSILHNNPKSSRLIIAAPEFSLKPLLIFITSAFKAIYKQI